MALPPTALAGQRDVRDFQYVKDINPVLQSTNPAMLTLWAGKISSVSLKGTKGNGAVIPLEGSPDDFSVCASTESFFRTSDKMVYHGSLFWDDYQGKDMGGPIMMLPDFYPVNFLESDETTLGTKKRSLYGLSGAQSRDIGERWALGFGFNYESGDMTKVKDPRFSNSLMDMKLLLGASFRASDALLLGLALQYRNLLEQVKGGIYGTSDTQYFIDTDKGGFWGLTSELAGDYNYISVSNLRPMSNSMPGISLQAVLNGCWSNELTFAYRKGFFGKKAAASPVFFDYSGYQASYESLLTLRSGDDLHRLSVSADFATLGNDENVYRYVTPEGQSMIVEYIGSNSILGRTEMNAGLDYRWYKDAGEARPGGTLGIRAVYAARWQTTVLYPFWRRQDYNNVSLDLYGGKCFRAGAFTLSLDGDIGAFYGWGTPGGREDGSNDDSAVSGLKSFDNYLNRFFEYKTAPRAHASLSFTLARTFKDSFEVYLTLSDRFDYLTAVPQYLAGRTRNLAGITLGCNF